MNKTLTGLNHVHCATLDARSMALDFRDQSTSGHSRRVADLTAGAARVMGAKNAALVQIESREFDSAGYPRRLRGNKIEVRRCTGTQFDPDVVEPTLEDLSDHIPKHLK